MKIKRKENVYGYDNLHAAPTLFSSKLISSWADCKQFSFSFAERNILCSKKTRLNEMSLAEHFNTHTYNSIVLWKMEKIDLSRTSLFLSSYHKHTHTKKINKILVKLLEKRWKPKKKKKKEHKLTED